MYRKLFHLTYSGNLRKTGIKFKIKLQTDISESVPNAQYEQVGR